MGTDTESGNTKRQSHKDTEPWGRRDRHRNMGSQNEQHQAELQAGPSCRGENEVQQSQLRGGACERVHTPALHARVHIPLSPARPGPTLHSCFLLHFTRVQLLS